MQAESQGAAITPLRVLRSGAPPERAPDPAQATTEAQPQTAPSSPAQEAPTRLVQPDAPSPRRAFPRRMVLSGGAALIALGVTAWAAPYFGVRIPFIGKPAEQRQMFSQSPPGAPAQPAPATAPSTPFDAEPDPFDGPGIAAPSPAVRARATTRAPAASATQQAALARPVTQRGPETETTAATTGAGTLAAPDSASTPTRTSGPAATDTASPLQNKDTSIELQLASKLDTLSQKITALETKMAQTEQSLNEKLSTGLGKLDGRLDALEHREDATDEALRGGRYRATSITPKTAPKPAATASAAAGSHTSGPPAKRPRYSVQAGAPGLAIITDGAGRALRVTPGSPVEGWGNVVAITQSGDGWIVRTDNGVIR